ncbi:MAG: PAS domain-containing protein [Holophagales bacterium]|nr:PAS domain-containing protein [Holophagales bacterium]MYG30370.1 PAS domain-containing protein [Holophagales bacterium]MYI81416.1 PAS domain-containing protein [Holophagales bacterium]
MIRSPLFWRLFLGGIALLTSGFLLGGAVASGRVGAVLVWTVALLAGVGVGLAAGSLAKRARRLLARASTLGSPAPPGEAGSGDELARLEVFLAENEARFVEQVEQLKAERNRLTAVLGGMVEGVVAIDRDRRVLHLNAVAANWFGRPGPDLAVGRPIYELSRQPEISGALIEAMEKRAQVSRTFGLVRLAGEDGGPDRFELNASPLLSSRRDGELVEGAVAVIHDITELERLESVRRDFVSNVSHELKTPLTAIRGYVETLLDADPIDGPTRGRFLRKIRRQSNRLGALVSDLLILSRIESSTEPPEKVLDLRSAAGEVLNLLGPASEERGLELVAEFPDEAVEVLGEEEAIRQALSNLVDNAVKYSSAGGRVLVRLRAQNGRAVLEVEDEGPGIASEHLERIFERFYRVDRARSRELGGTGLGLAIVKNVARRHGGGVEVESERGRGSTFRLWLPAAE